MVQIGRARQVAGIVLPGLPATPELRQFPQPALAPGGVFRGTPQGIGMGMGQVVPTFVRPYHLAEIYGAPRKVNVAGLDTGRRYARVEPIPIRPVMYRPNIPKVRIVQAPKRVVVNPRPIVPAPPGPNLPRLPRLPVPQPMQMVVKPITPPVKGGDVGGLLSSTSPWAGSIAFSSGRTFEETSKLY